jgi:hypothetical protein
MAWIEQGPGGLITVLVNGTSMDVPPEKGHNYAQTENGGSPVL